MTLESPESQDTSTDDLASLIPVHGSEESAPKTPASEPAPADQGQPTQPTPEQTPSELEELKQANERLRRLIAQDPQALAGYAQQTYGVPLPQAPQQAPPAQQPIAAPEAPKSIEDAFAEAFPGEEYDPYNIRHSAFLNNFNLKPAMSYIEQLKQQEQKEQERLVQQQAEQQIDALAVQVEDIFTQKMPFFKDILEAGDNLSPKQKFVANETRELFQQTLTQMFPANQMVNGQPFNPLWVMPEAYHEVVAVIAPQVAKMAAEMGLDKPKPKVNADMAKDAYVESPNAVPTPTNDFAAAIQNYDMATMIEAIPVFKAK
jgi:hypothetical protein